MKIRDRLPLLAVLCCFSALLLLPEVSAQAARDAMLLCAQTLIPSLFPFFVLSSPAARRSCSLRFCRR